MGHALSSCFVESKSDGHKAAPVTIDRWDGGA